MSRPSMSDPWWLAAVRWPLWSWRRLGITTAVALALMWTAGAAQNALGRTAETRAPGSAASAASAGPGITIGQPATSTSPDPAGSSSAPIGPSPSSAAPPASGSSTAGSPTALVIGGAEAAQARTFVTAWARPDLPAAQWFAGLEPLITLRLAQLLRQTDPGRVPATRVIDVPGAAPAGQSGSAAPASGRVEVIVRTDTGPVRVTLVASHGRWLIDAIAPDAQPPSRPSPSAKTR